MLEEKLCSVALDLHEDFEQAVLRVILPTSVWAGLDAVMHALPNSDAFDIENETLAALWTFSRTKETAALWAIVERYPSTLLADAIATHVDAFTRPQGP